MSNDINCRSSKPKTREGKIKPDEREREREREREGERERER